MKSIRSQIRNLSSIFPWVRKRSMSNLIEIGLPVVKEIVAALDTPWAPIVTQGWNSSTDSILEFNRATKRYELLREVLLKIGAPAIAELENALHHPNLNVRFSAMEAILRIGHPSIADLGKIGSPKGFDRIVAALDDESSYVRKIAIIALGNLGNPSVLPKLERI